MKDSAKEIANLIYEYLRNGLSSSEKKQLWEWINESEANQKYFKSITSRAELESILDQLEYPDKEGIWQKITPEKITPEEIAAGSGELTTGPLPYTMHTPSRFKWWKYAAAATIIISLGAGWFFFNRAAKAEDATARFKNDVLPPISNRTVLTLANGRVLVLDSVQTGMLTQQGNTQISLQDDDQLVFQLKTSGTATMASSKLAHKNSPGSRYSEAAHLPGTKSTTLYNTISTARGGTYRLQLPDESLVWINAASTLRFPAAFTGPERKVELTGEAYFEIKPQYVAGSKQKKVPFKVAIRSSSGADLGEIEVLGTKFNVNAYEDEQIIKTTLTEGSVKIKNGTVRSLLKPGQQGLIKPNSSHNSTGSIKIQSTPNEEEVLAWKNGLFVFDNTSLETIMRHVARWYDVSVVYEEKVNRNLHGSIPRNVPLSSVLKILELADGVHFKISGKTITVTR